MLCDSYETRDRAQSLLLAHTTMTDRHRRSASPMSDDDAVEPPRKRFRWESQSAQLKAIRVDGSKQRRRAALALTSEHRAQQTANGQSNGATVEEDDETLLKSTPISTALDDLALDHLTARYVALSSRLRPLVRTLPLALLNIRETYAAFGHFLAGVNVKLGGASGSNEASGRDSGLEGALILVERWIESVREETINVRIDVPIDEPQTRSRVSDEDEAMDMLEQDAGETATANGDRENDLEPDDIEAALDEPAEPPAEVREPHRTISRSIFAALCAALLRVGALQGLDPSLVEKTYGCLAGVVRIVAGEVLAESALPEDEAVALMSPLDELLTVTRPYLSRTAKPHVRACVADVLAALARRARGTSARRFVRALLNESRVPPQRDNDSDDQNDDDVGVALVLSAAAKGQGQGLHSRAAGIYSEVLAACDRDEASATGGERTTRIARWLTTALIHHSSPTAMQPLHELVLSQLEGLKASSATSSMLRIASVLLGVRKGQRVPTGFVQRYLRALADNKLLERLKDMQTQEDDVAARWRTEYIRAIVAGLIAGKLADWLSPGVRLIDSLWVVLVSSLPGQHWYRVLTTIALSLPAASRSRLGYGLVSRPIALERR